MLDLIVSSVFLVDFLGSGVRILRLGKVSMCLLPLCVWLLWHVLNAEFLKKTEASFSLTKISDSLSLSFKCKSNCSKVLIRASLTRDFTCL